MADANRTAIRVARETSSKVLPANPLWQPLRITSATLAYTPETATSNEIDATRQVNDEPLIGFGSGGDVPMEYSIGNSDVLMEGLMMNTWNRSPEVHNGATWKYGAGSAAATRFTALSATTLTLTANAVLAGSSIASPGTVFAVGHLMYLSGLGVGLADQILRVTGSGATSVTVAGATAVASPAATARVKVVGLEGVSGDVGATTVGGNALTSTALNFTQMGLIPGQWVYLGGMGTSYGFAAFGGFARVGYGMTATRLPLDVVPTGFVTDTAAGKTVRVFFTDTIKNGVIEDLGYQVEEEFGLTGGVKYLYHRGQEVATRVISGETKAIITDTWTFLGADALPITAARPAGSVTLNPAAGNVLNTSTSVPLLLEGGSPVTDPNFVNSFGITIDNAKRARDAVGVLGSADIGSGRLSVTGTLNTYFGTEALYNKVVTNAISQFAVGFVDTAGSRGEVMDIPKLKYSSGAPTVTGIDTDIFVPLAFRGLRDIAGGRDYTIMFSRFEYTL